LVAELRLDRDRHLKYFRMSAEQMDHILSLIGGHLSRQTTNYRQSIQPKQRLAVTLSFTSLAFQYRLGKSTVAESVHMTCRAIEEQMMASQFPRPTEHMWRAIASKFWDKWNFTNCLGAIDGKHVTIMSPAHSGSLFFKYKRTFSIVLLALADAEYRFTFVQVGDFGRTSDGGVFSGSALGRGMEAKTLSVPADCPLPGSGVQGPLPYTMVGDAAFPLKTYLMRPFPGNRIPRWRQMFNYRLSQARMVVECAFGILSSRWRVLHTRINVKPDNADSIVTAACILHNFLTNPSDNQRWLDEAEERGEVLAPATNMGGNRGCREAYEVREKLCTFFSSPEGRVSWQDNMV
uniref:DDE Tnp4 domain-containing protein n=1 Tax=Cyprinus carpio TaxID=7962 RepID=A0A8C1VZS8_CYPCA